MRILITLFGLMAFSACAGNVCAEGDNNCKCQSAGVCEWTCPGGNCAYSNSGQGDATFECEAGGCSLNASAQGNTTFDCAGGNCTVSASGQGNVTLNCAGGGCDVDCGGQGSCIINHCAECSCEDSITSECEVNGG